MTVLREAEGTDQDIRDIKMLIFDKGKFPAEDDVRQWCRKNHFLSSAVHLSQDGDEWHVQQRKDGDFINDKRSIIKVAPGVKAEVGQARESAAAPDAKASTVPVREYKGVGLAKLESGDVVLAEGGRYLLKEDAGDMARMSDGKLKDLRATMVGKRTDKRKAHGDLSPEDKYGSPEGSALLDDLYYYGNLISQIEREMSDRMLPLD